MVTINKSTFRQNVYETIYDTLTSANLLSGTVTVTAAYIDDDQSFPQVVVHPITSNKDEWAFQKSNHTNHIKVMIDVWTKKNKERDQITDEIDSLSDLKSITGLSLEDWSESPALEPKNDNKLHLTTITIVYRYRG